MNNFLIPSVVLVVLNLIAIFLLINISYANKRNIKITSDYVDKIGAQFKADSGTSLRDVINRIEMALDDNRTLVRGLKSAVDIGGATGLRIEVQAGHVADDLQEAQGRADAVDVAAEPGVASDAASRGGT